MAEHRTQKNVMDTVTKVREKMIVEEDKVTHIKYETMNSAVQRFCLDMAFMKEKGAGSAASAAAACTGSGGSLVNGQTFCRPVWS